MTRPDRTAELIARQRTRNAKISRLRERVRQAAALNPEDPVPGILAGILDVLEHEL